MAKHIFVTGGVVSSLGKGITSASLAMLLKNRGYRVAMQKFDPYINVDSGTMSPLQHGEVFVTDDGAEADLDLGHYERFTGISCNKNSDYTTGRIYKSVIDRERAGEYHGNTVQIIPHITDEIKGAIKSAIGPEVDIVVSEIGGTAGDIESLPYLEAARQFKHDAGPGNAIFIHLTLVPFIRAAGELKTKPSQQSVAVLRNIGIVPDMLVCRTEVPMEQEHMDKLALFCNVAKEMVVEELDVKHTIYEVPSELARQGLDIKVLEALRLPVHKLDLSKWDDIIERAVNPERSCRVALVGKNASVRDAHKSVHEALSHAGVAARAKVEVVTVEADDFEARKAGLSAVDAFVMPGGFGRQGVAGMISAVRHARENAVPLLGVGLGMQCMVIEFARSVLGWADANSVEFAPDAQRAVIDLSPRKSGAMRLGACPCKLAPGSAAARAYGDAPEVSERHRHRHEFNNNFREHFQRAGLCVSGTSPDGQLVEIVEVREHPFFIGCQFHPEFKSRPDGAHPLFRSLVEAALKQKA